MEKFSLYDLLSVLFPGVLFLYMLDGVSTSFGIAPYFILTSRWEIMIILAVLLGAFIYVLSFCLVKRWKWIYKICGVYAHVSTLYTTLCLQEIIGKTLNQKANEWYQQDLFFSKMDFLLLIFLIPALKPELADSARASSWFAMLILVAVASVALARWYRKRMVLKMYWYFYSHINIKDK